MKYIRKNKTHGSERGIHVPVIEMFRNNQLSGLVKNNLGILSK